LRECGEGGDDICLSHNSIYIKTLF
jgi:hypothetical protein